MARINRKRILRNIVEAREQLEDIERQVSKISEPELQVLFEHAYHHMNWAWNTRSVPQSVYDGLTDRDFNKWSRIPKDLEPLRIDLRRKRDDG